MKQLKKRAQVVNNLQAFVMSIVTIGVVLAIGLFVLQEVAEASNNCGTGYFNETSQRCEVSISNATLLQGNTDAYNATTTIVTKLATAPTWIGILIIVVFASAVLAYFYVKG